MKFFLVFHTWSKLDVHTLFPELVAQKEAELETAVAEAIEIRDLMQRSIPTPDLTKTEADLRRERNGQKPSVKVSKSPKQQK